jgi:acetyl-CoA synthetase
MRTVYGDHQRFIDTYFSQFDGKYFTGDGCRRDEDGYYWITGRVDDVIIVSGHNLGTAELESAFVAHPKVAEAAVVGYPHDIKGNGLYCYVTLNSNEKPSGELERDLKLWVRKQIGPIATPDLIQFAPSLPKTRSGKIMRRILRKIAANEQDQLGDSTTVGSAKVVVSPNWSCSFAAIFLSILLIIFPDLVFGKLGANCIKSGVAIGPICFLTQSFKSLSNSPEGFSPAFNVT